MVLMLDTYRPYVFLNNTKSVENGILGANRKDYFVFIHVGSFTVFQYNFNCFKVFYMARGIKDSLKIGHRI